MPLQYDLGGNVFFCVAFALLLFPQLYYGVRYKTWGFSFGMISGLVLEVIGYSARIMLHNGERQFVMYIVTLTIAPAFFSAATYLSLARVITAYGEKLSRFRPRTIAIGFMFMDFFALLLQSAGGALAGSDDEDLLDTSLSILQAGLAVHLIGIVAYVGISCEFAYAVYSSPQFWDPSFQSLQHSKRFQFFLYALAASTFFILVRTTFRMAELSQGFDSSIARNEPAFFGLDGTMILLAGMSLSVCHPGPAFLGRWAEADFHLRQKKVDIERKENARATEYV